MMRTVETLLRIFYAMAGIAYCLATPRIVSLAASDATPLAVIAAVAMASLIATTFHRVAKGYWWFE